MRPWPPRWSVTCRPSRPCPSGWPPATCGGTVAARRGPPVCAALLRQGGRRTPSPVEGRMAAAAGGRCAAHDALQGKVHPHRLPRRPAPPKAAHPAPCGGWAHPARRSPCGRPADRARRGGGRVWLLAGLRSRCLPPLLPCPTRSLERIWPACLGLPPTCALLSCKIPHVPHRRCLQQRRQGTAGAAAVWADHSMGCRPLHTPGLKVLAEGVLAGRQAFHVPLCWCPAPAGGARHQAA